MLLDSCRTVRELHVSHNCITETGVTELIQAAERLRRDGDAPLWLRVECNDLEDSEAMQTRMVERFAVCPMTPRCSNRVCAADLS